jgi:hypothetical protein
MRCEQAQERIHDRTAGGDLPLRLHLWRCRDCRAQAAQARAVSAALASIPRFAPSPELLTTVLAVTSNPVAKTRKETGAMRRLVYAGAFVLVLALVSGGLLVRPRKPDGRALLISAAQAMEEAKTIHVRGRANVSENGSPEWGELDKGHYEDWYSPEGTRNDFYDADGSLQRSLITNVATGMSWESVLGSSPWFPKGVVTAYPVGTRKASLIVERSLKGYLEGNRWIADSNPARDPVKTRSGMWNGKAATIVTVDNTYAGGQGMTEFYLDPRTGHLVGLRGYGPESAGRPLVAEMESVEYGIEIPSTIFDYDVPAGAATLEDDFEVSEDANYRFQGPGSFGGPDRKTRTDAWHVSTSAATVAGDAGLAIDGDTKTAWTGRGRQHLQQPGMWFQLDFDTPVMVSKMMLQPAASPGKSASGWPRGAQITATSDGANWEDVYTGQAGADLPLLYGHLGRSRPIRAIRITLTAVSDEDPWSIGEIEVYGKPQ